MQPRGRKERPLLRVLIGGRGDEVFAVTAREVVIGRDPSANIYINASGISRHHAKVICAQDGLLSLVDLNSTNGTYLNGVKVAMSLLREGDRIQLGPAAELVVAYEPSRGGPSQLSQLTPRQLEVARRVATGRTNREVAAEMGVSERTVTSHLDHIYTRLGITSRTALAHLLARAGEIPE